MDHRMDISIACNPSFKIVLVQASPIASAVNLLSTRQLVRTKDVYERKTRPTQ